MKIFSAEKDRILKLTTGGYCYYPQMKLLVYPVSIRVVYFSGKVGLHPIVLTLCCIISSVLCLISFWFELYLLSLFFYWARTVFDYSDGALARFTNKETKIGGYLDGYSDKVFYLSLWILITLSINTIIGKLYFIVSYLLYFIIVRFYILPRLGQLKKRAVVKQYFLDRGILIGIGIATELEFWSVVFFTVGLAPQYLWILVLLNNIDLLYRIYEILRFYDPSRIPK